jgi:hypothetical protein
MKKDDSNVKGVNLQIWVCPTRNILEMWGRKSIPNDYVSKMLELQIRSIIISSLNTDAYVKVHWIDQHTVIKPCAPDIRFEDDKKWPQ